MKFYTHTFLAFSVVAILGGCQSVGRESGDLGPIGSSSAGLTAAGAHSWADVQVAYDRAQRLRDLFGIEAPASLIQAQIGLGNLLSGVTPATASTIDAAIASMLAAQAQAYAVAVDTGRATPGVADPGAWDATWWDVSSP